MKAILNLRKSIIYVAAFAAMFSMASCDDNDDPQVLTLNDANGTFEGNMVFSLREAATDPTNVIKVVVESANKISTDSIPLEQFIVAIEGKEKTAEIMKKIKAQKYSASYTGNLNEAKDSIYMTVTAQPLVFKYTLPAEEGEEEAEAVEKEVKVTFSTKEKANSYSLAKVLKLSIDVEKIEVGGTELADYKKQNIQFKLNKK